jgi:hypothetical protein
MEQLRVEPIRKEVESDKSFVVSCWALDSFVLGAPDHVEHFDAP